jgi:hypothetical protein
MRRLIDGSEGSGRQDRNDKSADDATGSRRLWEHVGAGAAVFAAAGLQDCV